MVPIDRLACKNVSPPPHGVMSRGRRSGGADAHLRIANATVGPPDVAGWRRARTSASALGTLAQFLVIAPEKCADAVSCLRLPPDRATARMLDRFIVANREAILVNTRAGRNSTSTDTDLTSGIPSSWSNSGMSYASRIRVQWSTRRLSSTVLASTGATCSLGG